MKHILLPLLILVFLQPHVSASHICYFSLNNKKEFTEMEKFTSRLNKVSSEKIEISEFMVEDSDAEESFLKMVETGVKCDGLVISGHHTGSFGGMRGEGTLEIDFIESLSCDPKYKDFFHSIKALWLQGCRTLGVEKIETLDTAEYQMNRVYDLREEDHLDQGPLQMNIEVSQTLDQDNPLSSRYLRIFPRATVFGWTKTSPGQNAMSERSIPFHIANLARMNDDRKAFFDDPTSEFGKESAVKYADAVLSLLNRSEENERCGLYEDVAAWIAHGNWSESRKYAFDNPNINGYKSLVAGDYGPLWEAKSLECILKNSSDHQTILSTIRRAVMDPFLVGFTYNSLFEVLKRASREGDLELYDKVKNELLKSPYFTNFIMEKLADDKLGIVRTIEYYSLYKELVGKSNVGIENKIIEAFASFMSKDINGVDGVDFDLRDAQMTLAQAVIKNKLITSEALVNVINDTKSNEVLISIVSALEQYPVKSSVSVFSALIKSKSTAILKGTGLAMGAADISPTEREKLIQKMVEKHGDRGVSGAISALKVSSCAVDNCSKLILNLAKTSGDRARYEIANLLGSIDVEFSDIIASELASKITSSRYLGRFAGALGRMKGVSTNTKVDILTELSERPDVSKENIAKGLGSIKGLNEEQLELFDKLVIDSKARTQLVSALAHSEISDQKYRDRFTILLEGSNGDDRLVQDLASELIYTSKFSREERDKIWNTLIRDSGVGEVAYWNIGQKILKLDHITDEEVKMLRDIYGSLKDEYFSENFRDIIIESKKLDPGVKELIFRK